MAFAYTEFAACLGLFFIFTNSAIACECTGDGRVENAVESATAVFIGKVTDIRESRTFFQIEKIMKGDKDTGMLVVHRGLTPHCDFDFRQGEEYFVFAGGPLGRLTVSKCSLTSEWGRERFSADEKGSGFRLSVLQMGIFCALIFAGILLYSNILPRKNKENR